MSRGQRNSANDAQFKEYRDLAPAAVDDSKIYALIKEHRNKKEKINETISGWWENLPSQHSESEEWVFATKSKKTTQSNTDSQQNGGDRNGGGGRGRSRGVTSGGRGNGRERTTANSGRPSSPREANTNASRAASISPTNAPAVVASTTNDAPIAGTSAVGSSSSGNAWGQKSVSLTETTSTVPVPTAESVPAARSTSAASSNYTKKSDTAAAKTVTANFPSTGGGAWGGNVETAAQKIKRIENEKNKPKHVENEASVGKFKSKGESTNKPGAAADKGQKKKKGEKKERTPRSKPAATAAANGSEDALPASELSETKSLLENLSMKDNGDAPASPKADKNSAANGGIETVDSSPKIGLKMGKWETKAERIETPSLSFGSFGNATNLVSEDAPASASASAWGANTSASSGTDVSVSGAAVWSNNSSSSTSDILQTDVSGNGSNSQNQAQNNQFEQKNVAPPGLGSQTKPHQRGAPGQSRNKQDNQGSQQVQQQNGYQQAPGFGRGGQNNTMQPANNVLYGGHPSGFDYQNMQPFPQVPGMAPSTSGGSGNVANTNSAGTSSTSTSATAPNQPQQQQQQQQAYAQPTGVNSGYYPQNPYYGYQPNMAPFNYYNQAAVQGGYYGHNQGGRGYQGGRGGPGGYAEQYNPNVPYSQGDNFSAPVGQFNEQQHANPNNAAGSNNQNNNAGNKSKNNASNIGSQQELSQQNVPGQVQQHFGYPVNPYNVAAPGGWGAYPSNGGYNAQMYPGSAPLGGSAQMHFQPPAQNGGRDNQQRGGYGNYNGGGSSNNRTAPAANAGSDSTSTGTQQAQTTGNYGDGNWLNGAR